MEASKEAATADIKSSLVDVDIDKLSSRIILMLRASPFWHGRRDADFPLTPPSLRRPEENGALDGKLGRVGTRLTVLVQDKDNNSSILSYESLTSNATLTLLDYLGIPTDVVDGIISSQKQKKDELCDISGIRESPNPPFTVYPQIFLSSESGEKHRYLGGYDWLRDTDLKQLAALCDIPLNETECLGLALFPHAFRSGYFLYGRYPRTLLELKMLQIMQAIAEKQDWQTKLRHDPSIFNRWVMESQVHKSVVQYAVDEMLSRDIDIRVIERCPKSLTDICNSIWRSLPDLGISGLPQEVVDRVASYHLPAIKFLGLEGVYARDDIGDALHAKLCTGVEHLRCKTAPDWHPGSNEQMLDLVHPSLFPLISGLSRRVTTTRVPWSELLTGSCDSEVVNFMLPNDCLPESMSTTYLGMFPNDTLVTNARDSYAFSKKYQWLPSEFVVADDSAVTVSSYINNLHPRVHADLYQTIGEVFRECIPLLECCLTDLRQYPLKGRHDDSPLNYEMEYEPISEDDDSDDVPVMVGTSVSSEMDTYVRSKTPPPYVKLRGRTLKVIVKLANIMLTPEKPDYDGGAWHIEGMGNESIVATAIYYYSQENVTQSTLAFREAVSEPGYEQGDTIGVRKVYGMEDEGPLNQVIGAVNTNNGRILAFPNVFQHQVQSFTLVDKQQPGHRNVLVFFLCDPAALVESSATILPLQRDWWSIENSCIPPNATTLTLDEAKVHRAELMTERKYFVEANDEKLFERNFSLCEH